MNYSYLIFFLFYLISNSFSLNKLVYLEPKPYAKYVSIDNNIILRFEKPVPLNDKEISNCIIINGSESSFHSGKIITCEENKKIIFKTDNPFKTGEIITVRLVGKLSKNIEPEKDEYVYRFCTESQKIIWNPMENLEKESQATKGFSIKDNIEDFPLLTVSVNDNPAQGDIFLANNSNYTYSPYLIITDKNGLPYYYVQKSPLVYDFKKEPNGNLTYYDGYGVYKHYELDVNYNTVNSYYCGNGYITDLHELRVLNNGHAYVLAYDRQYVDMSLIVPGGQQNATVIGLIIQEIDQNKNVVFQWRSWDHFAITDAWHENMYSTYIDCVHGNAIEIDNDSNLVISSRHLDEITKINHVTGAIIWRLGGKHNQFTFIGDTLKFTYQHAVRRIANGHITLFDNGNFHTPHFSRVVEYDLDEINKTANAVWEYRHSPDIYSPAMGYAQRLSNGNTLIGWGEASPSVTEVTPSGSVTFEMSLPPGIFSYRAYKYDWLGAPLSIENQKNSIPSSYSLNQNYPNPFNPSTSFKFAVPRKGMIKVVIYDILGNEVRTLINEERNAGTYTINFDASTLSSGVYFYKMIAESFTETKKMILLK